MHYSWLTTPEEIMTQKCYVLKNVILSAIENNKMKRKVERNFNVAIDILIRRKYN